mgnify:CR=1 FL=1
MTITRIAESAVTATRLVKAGTAATQCALCGAGETPIGVSANSAGTGELVTIHPVSGDPAGVTATDSIEFLSADGWTSANWTGGWVAGWAHTAGNTSALVSPTAAVAGRKYTVSWTVTSRTAGTFSVAFGGHTYPTLDRSGLAVLVASTTGALTITPSSTFDGTMALSIVCSRIQFGDSVGVAAGGLAQTHSTGLLVGTAISDANTGETLTLSFSSALTGGGGPVINIVATVPTADPGVASGTSAYAFHYTTSLHGLYFWNGTGWERLI